MATKALVVVGTDPKRTRQALEKLPQPYFSVTGRFDGILTLQNETPKALSEAIFNQVRSLDGVVKTETYTVLREVQKTTTENYPVKAYVFVRTEPQKFDSIFGSLAGFSETSYTAAITGRYDIAVQIGARTWEEFTNTLLGRIRNIEGVRDTETFLVVN